MILLLALAQHEQAPVDRLISHETGLRIGDASKVAPVDKLSLVLVAVFAVLFLGERPSGREWLGILMVGAGVLILGLKR